MKGRTILIVLTVLFYSAEPAHISWPEQKDEIKSESRRAELTKLFPKVGDLSGWTPSGDILLYHPETLWDYINGQAEVYLQYGFQAVGTADYVSKGGDDSIVVEIYRMKSSRHGFGIYAAERRPGDHFMDMGVEGYLGDNVLNFWKGPNYVKITSFQNTPAVKKGLLHLARIIDRKIPGCYEEPALFACFPEQNRVKKSERFIPSHFLGQSFLSNGYRVDYERGQERFQVFLVENSTAKQAEEAFKKYQDFLVSAGKKTTLEKKSSLYKLTAGEERKEVIFLYGSFVGGILNIREMTEADPIIRNLVENLEKRTAR